jgi:hypothetical protein
MLATIDQRVRVVLALAITLPGCGGDAEGDPDAAVLRCPLGDAEAVAELSIVHLDREFVVNDTTELAEVPLQLAPQGGWAVLIGVRATNLDGCQLNLTTSLQDSIDSQILKIDSRPIRLEDTGDGWGVSALSGTSALQACPAPTATRNLYDEPYVVSVMVEDLDGKRATSSVTIIPTCPEDSAMCRCECDREHVVGECATNLRRR